MANLRVPLRDAIRTNILYYPQRNGKIERWHQILKQECIRPDNPLALANAKRIISTCVEQYNHYRRHSAIGYFIPAAKLNQREAAIFDQRQQKLAQAHEQYKLYCQ